MKKVRCAIYTRKSNEEGLEQDFNSLDAQHEACAAYIASQASEGWSQAKERYDDGGLSGGSLDRPGLQRLLADIEAGRIDIVVVYKVDRLTRSLLDFARLVETFDAAGSSFVSVTQSFNTTNSMGRLTLNMLLSFAQFEREVTAERIRDKIAASKAKGMWMGGIAPLGYRGENRTLGIVPEDAKLIHSLFNRYLATGNVRLLAEALETEGVRVPLRTTGTGRKLGGCSFSRGQIYKILSNPTYLGKICHRGAIHEGQHDAIIERGLWEKVQAKLAENTKGAKRAPRTATRSLLAGRVFDEHGEPLVAEHCSKLIRRGIDDALPSLERSDGIPVAVRPLSASKIDRPVSRMRYRYYVSRSLHRADRKDHSGIRIPAKPLEELVMIQVARLLDDPIDLIARAQLNVQPSDIERTAGSSRDLAAALRDGHRETLRLLLKRVEIGSQIIVVQIDPATIAASLGVPRNPDAAPEMSITIDAQLRRTGKVVRFVDGNDSPITRGDQQPQLIDLLRRARAWWHEMQRDDISVTEIAEHHQTDSATVSRTIRLNFLSPAIVQQILVGRQPIDLDARSLQRFDTLPIEWQDQEKVLLVS